MMVFAHARAALLRTCRSSVIAAVLGSAFVCGIAFAPPLAAIPGTLAPDSSAGRTGASPVFDCSSYQKLLDEYLVVTSPPGQPLETRFDYIALERREDHATKFALISQELLNVEPSRMKDTERLAWAINAYNFLVIQAVTENMFEPFHVRQKGQKKFIYRNRHSTVETMSVGGEKFFEATVVEIEGRSYSLNTFERHFVFADYDSTKRQAPPKRLDPRAHFALVCAAKGCPPLRRRCYRADSLDQQLETASREALAEPGPPALGTRHRQARGILDLRVVQGRFRRLGGSLRLHQAIRASHRPGGDRSREQAVVVMGHQVGLESAIKLRTQERLPTCRSRSAGLPLHFI